MEKTVLTVKGMSCEHCVRAVTTAISSLPGVSGIKVDLASGTVSFEYDPEKSPLDTIKAVIEDQGYEVV